MVLTMGTPRLLGAVTAHEFSGEGFARIKVLQPVLDVIKRLEEHQGVSQLNESRFIESIFVTLLAMHHNITFVLHRTRLGEVLRQIREPERNCFISLVCHLALLKILGYSHESVEFSNELLRLGFGSLSDINTFGLIDVRTEHEQPYQQDSNSYSFVDLAIQKFLAAVFLSCQPITRTFDFIKQYILSEDQHQSSRADCEDILHFCFAIGDSGLTENRAAVLFHVIHFLCQFVNTNNAIIDDRIVVLVISCLYQMQNEALCLQVHNEFFQHHTISYNVSKIEDKLSHLAYYLVCTTQKRRYWTVYCSEERAGNVIMKKSQEQGGNVLIRCCSELTQLESGRVIISKNYPHSVMAFLISQHQSTNSQAFTETSSSSTAVVVAPTPPPTHNILVGYDPVNKYLTEEQSEKCTIVSYSNMVENVELPRQQLHRPTMLARSRYHKGDRIWSSCSGNINNEVYENIQITPIAPLVKVVRPNGSLGNYERYQNIVVEQLQKVNTSTDFAELVFSSHHGMQVSVVPSTANFDVSDANSRPYMLFDENESVLIGYDHLKEEYQVTEDVQETISYDNQYIIQDLPLPIERNTTSTDMTPVMGACVTFSRDLSLQHLLPTCYQETLGTTGSLVSARCLEEEEPPVPDHQIRCWALEAYDHPGQCFYSIDSSKFKVGQRYNSPYLQPFRVLREGGNGIVLEVSYKGHLYAVKCTAFRWREVLIMPKLRHDNVLRLSAMLMGTPREGSPQNRCVFHFNPRMTSDLDKMFRSSLRTLNKYYSNNPTHLCKIHSNFRYIIREILQGLHYLHTLPNPIIHRDIKPSNILVMKECLCPDLLTCMCIKRPHIVLSDFDASLELNHDGTLRPDPLCHTTHGTPLESVYRISRRGTKGFMSPEDFICMVGNSADVMPPLTTKADIFSFGLMMCLLLMNEHGPKSLYQMGVILLDMNRRTEPKSSSVPYSRLSQVIVTDYDIHKILPIGKLKEYFSDPFLVDFVMRCLEIDPANRSTAYELLTHPYLQE